MSWSGYTQQADGAASSSTTVSTGTNGSGFGSSLTAGNILLVQVGYDNNFVFSTPSLSFSGTATLGTPTYIGNSTDSTSSGKQNSSLWVPITGSGTCVV